MFKREMSDPIKNSPMLPSPAFPLCCIGGPHTTMPTWDEFVRWGAFKHIGPSCDWKGKTSGVVLWASNTSLSIPVSRRAPAPSCHWTCPCEDGENPLDADWTIHAPLPPSVLVPIGPKAGNPSQHKISPVRVGDLMSERKDENCSGIWSHWQAWSGERGSDMDLVRERQMTA